MNARASDDHSQRGLSRSLCRSAAASQPVAMRIVGTSDRNRVPGLQTTKKRGGSRRCPRSVSCPFLASVADPACRHTSHDARQDELQIRVLHRSGCEVGDGLEDQACDHTKPASIRHEQVPGAQCRNTRGSFAAGLAAAQCVACFSPPARSGSVRRLGSRGDLPAPWCISASLAPYVSQPTTHQTRGPPRCPMCAMQVVVVGGVIGPRANGGRTN